MFNRMNKVQLEFNSLTLTVIGVLLLGVVFFAGISLGSDYTGSVVKTQACGETEACVKVVSNPAVQYKLVARDLDGHVVDVIEDMSGTLNNAPVHSFGKNEPKTSKTVERIDVFVISSPRGYNVPPGVQRSIQGNEFEIVYLDIHPIKD